MFIQLSFPALFGEPVVGNGGVHNIPIESHLFETSGSYRARTRTAHLVDRDANDCAISPPLLNNWFICIFHKQCSRNYEYW